jgi:ribulose-5-phosphate 4-epimerase/fuculose-1-phosphate aldolase
MSYLLEYADEVAAFVKVCHRLSELMYVTGHGGNLAWKLEEDLILITPTQLNKGQIEAEDVVFVNLSGKVVVGTRRPTGELPMYVRFFQDRPNITSVLHCHPPMTGAFAISKGKNWLMRPVFPETATEVGPVPVVPYGEPLTQRLADNFAPYVKKYNAFLMENHGLVIMSPKGIEWTLMLTELLEMTSVTILQALANGDIKEISEADVLNLENTMLTRGLPMFGAPGVNSGLVELFYPEG